MSVPGDDPLQLWDLSSALTAADQAEDEATARELRRIERGRVTLSQRLRGALGSKVRCRTVDGEAITGLLSTVYEDVVRIDGHYSWLVPLTAIELLTDLPDSRAATATGAERSSGRAQLWEWFDSDVIVGRTSAAVCAGRLLDIGQDYLELEQGGAGSVVVNWAAVAWVRAQS